VGLWALLLLKERASMSKWSCRADPEVDLAPPTGDELVKEVVDHEADVLGGQHEYRMRLEAVRKVYRGPAPKKQCCKPAPLPVHKVAVKDLTLGVAPGEIFGLLGVNGAGKTSVLKCLAGEQNASCGSLTVDNLDTVNHRAEVNNNIGYCPQFDSLLKLLTAREHIALFATLKGVKAADLDGVVNAAIRRISLEEHADRACGGYSGGNKRKLSTALALLAGPGVVLLDEPSTGMDPVARRFMWKFISASRNIAARGNGRRSVVLTTHAMEEAEALSNRMCIMVAGRIRALGTVQQLKTQFGGSYSLEIRVKDGCGEAVEKYIAALPWKAELLDQSLLILRYRISKNAMPSGVAMPEMFEVLEQAKASQGIAQYALSQTTLEQVFIHLAKEQYAEDEEGGPE